MPNIFSKLSNDGILDNNGDLDADKLAEEWLKDANFIRPPPSPVIKAKRQRTARERRDCKTSDFYKEYVLDVRKIYGNPDNRDGQLFRQRFSMDRSDYLETVEKIREDGFWEVRDDACGRPGCPLEVLILASLRILARNWTYDCCMEATYCSDTVIRKFFSLFVKWFADKIFPLFVKMPTLEEVESNGVEYARAGIPATIGSIDCVHVRLWNISANLRQMATGKEKYPSRAFEVLKL